VVCIIFATFAAKSHYYRNKAMRKNFVEELRWRGMLAQIMP
jgi:hypothetical protein